MNKSLFGLITLVAFGAVGFLVYNRVAENAALKEIKDVSNVAATTGSCCGDSIAAVKSSALCASGTVAKTGSCCSEGTLVATGAKSSCCSEGGACCAEKTATVSTSAEKSSCSCCEGKDTATVSTKAETCPHCTAAGAECTEQCENCPGTCPATGAAAKTEETKSDANQ